VWCTGDAEQPADDGLQSLCYHFKRCRGDASLDLMSFCLTFADSLHLQITHCRRRRDSTVELSRVGGVNAVVTQFPVLLRY